MATTVQPPGSAYDHSQPPSKVIVVAGFLGSGKTTLIDSILKAP